MTAAARKFCSKTWSESDIDVSLSRDMYRRQAAVNQNLLSIFAEISA
jgi:hypothetical protein